MPGMLVVGGVSSWIVADLGPHGRTEADAVELVRRAASAGADAITVPVQGGALDSYGVLAVRRAALERRVTFVPTCWNAADIAHAELLGAPVLKLVAGALSNAATLDAAVQAERPVWIHTGGVAASTVRRAIARLSRLRLVVIGTAPMSGLGIVHWGHTAHDGDPLRARAAVSRGASVIERPIALDAAACRETTTFCADATAFEAMARAVRMEEIRRRDRGRGWTAA